MTKGRYIRNLLLLISVTLLSACISFPKNSEKFITIQQLSSLDGCYRNLGIPVDSSGIPTYKEGMEPTIYLSRFIWEGLQDYEEFWLKTIKLQTTYDGIFFTGFIENEEKLTASWHINNEFIIRDGRLSLSRGFVFPGVLAGLLWESEELGLDTADNLKFRFDQRASGLIYFLWPVMMWLVEDRVFEKINCPLSV